MRLINVQTSSFEEFEVPPPYAILSHTWREGEITYPDYIAGTNRSKAGFQKIKNLCDKALDQSLSHVWIDTACIDKSSSAELSEAINSMFAWYREAKVCYVYLDDVHLAADIPSSRWISRGWTLQELIAPSNVEFYNQNWQLLGTKASMLENLMDWTSIDQAVLETCEALPFFNIANRMLWAASRQTTRIEDRAYCLLGIFGVNMPLLYGERENAFKRLQEAIMAQSNDPTLLVFPRLDSRSYLVPRDGRKCAATNVLAQGPEHFNLSQKVVWREHRESMAEITKNGMRVRMSIFHHLDSIESPPAGEAYDCLGVLDCRFEFDASGFVAIPLIWDWSDRSQTNKDEERFYVAHGPMFTVKHLHAPFTPVQLSEPGLDTFSLDTVSIKRHTCIIDAVALKGHGFEVVYSKPEGTMNTWDAETWMSEVCTSSRVLIRRFGFIHWSHREAFILSLANITHETGDVVTTLSVSVKPADQDCQEWLDSRDMYSSTPQPSTLLDDPIKLPGIRHDVEKWEKLMNGSFFKYDLLSGSCFQSLAVRCAHRKPYGDIHIKIGVKSHHR